MGKGQLAMKAGKTAGGKQVLKLASAKSKASKEDPKKGSKLDAKKLAKHSKQLKDMDLDDKIAYLKDKTPQEIKEFSKGFTKLEKSKLWNRHNTACNNHPDLKATRDAQTGRAAKGLLALSWNLDPNLGELYESLTRSITVSDKLKRHTCQLFCIDSFCEMHDQGS